MGVIAVTMYVQTNLHPFSWGKDSKVHLKTFDIPKIMLYFGDFEDIDLETNKNSEKPFDPWRTLASVRIAILVF